MKFSSLTLSFIAAVGFTAISPCVEGDTYHGRPDRFPRRIWAACDFEQHRQDVVWIGSAETANIPQYPGNTTACRARQFGKGTELFMAVKPVPPPRTNQSNGIYFRYYCEAVSSVTIELIIGNGKSSRIVVDDPVNGEWSELWANIVIEHGDASNGEYVLSDIVIIADCTKSAVKSFFLIDDIICFSNDPALSEAPDEPFPRRVIGVWQFDVFDDYHPWTKNHYAIVRHDNRLPNDWGVARSVKHPVKDYQWIRLIIEPLQAVGECTKLSFRYFQRNAQMLQVMIFDATVQDNRYIRLDDPVLDVWTTAVLNFTRDGIYNSGNRTLFKPGNRLDDIFFFPGFELCEGTELLIDDVVLYDAGPRN